MIIPAAGFDSVPSDLTAYLGVHALKKQYGPEVEVGQSTSAFDFKALEVSGGTIATVIDMVSGAIPRWALSKSKAQFSLSPSTPIISLL